MAKKFKGLTDNQLASNVKDSAHHIWLAGLGAFAKAQEEGGKAFEALVREGESIQKKTRKLTEETVADLSSKATGTWGRIEQAFEERVASALSSLGVPTTRDLDALAKRLDALTKAVEGLAKEKPAMPAAPKTGPSAAKPAVKKTAAPAAKTATKPVAKPAAKPVAKPATKSTAAPKPAPKAVAVAKKPAATKAPVSKVPPKPASK